MAIFSGDRKKKLLYATGILLVVLVMWLLL